MKITEMFPKLLQALYDNCNDVLSINILIDNKADSKIVEIKGGLINHKQQPNIKIDIDAEVFYKCYTYLTSAGLIIEENTATNARYDKHIQLTYKAINFIENYSLEGKV